MTLYLDPIRARLAAATPGPWEVDECSDETTVIVAGSDLTIICSELWQGWEGTQDAALIANAPADLAALLAEVERLRTELADRTPAACDMKHEKPYDFAWCKTHDSTFPLGEKCKFDGREPWEVYADEADEQRRRAVRAEMQVERLRETMQRVREASKRHPDACDRYDEDDPITCGWRRAVADMRAALESEARP